MNTIFVDLDGSLLKSDSLHEVTLEATKKSPHLLLQFPLWLLKGKAYFKNKLLDHVDPNVSEWPYNEEVVSWLHSEKQKGRDIVLATGANSRIAAKVASYHGIFSDYIASDDAVNLTGKNKLNVILERQKGLPFDYLGNSLADLEIWHKAENSIIVGRKSFVNRLAKNINFAKSFFTSTKISGFVKAMRVHQWTKNVLIFLPLILAKKVTDENALMTSIQSFFAFSFCSSSVYILNDLLDLRSDRAHKSKKNRPFASGAISIATGVPMVPLLLCISALYCVGLPIGFWYVLGFYYLTTLGYSLFLKTVPIVDVLTLSGLYAIRIFAGSQATHIEVSHWLLMFSIFLFLSLAFVKRYTELFDLGKAEGESKDSNLNGRGYNLSDLQIVSTIGVSCGNVSVLVLVLYLNSDHVRQLYHSPVVLWGLVPLCLFWISRVWLLAARGAMHEDPIVFALKDKPSFLVGILAGLTLLFASIL